MESKPLLDEKMFLGTDIRMEAVKEAAARPTDKEDSAITAAMNQLSLNMAPPDASLPATPLELQKQNVGIGNTHDISSPHQSTILYSSTPPNLPNPPNLLKKTSLSSLTGSTSSRPAPLRRTSSNLSFTSHTAMPSKMVITQLPGPTADSIARDYFQKDLQLHSFAEGLPSDVDTLVVLHDACYGHRYERPRTSDEELESIVERPERIKAVVLGIASAYVRLGSRHVGGQYHPQPNNPPLPTQFTPFHILKTSRLVPLLSPTVTQVHGQRWMADLKSMCEAAEERLVTNRKELTRPAASSGAKVAEKQTKLHDGDLYLCSESLSALEGAIGGVCEALDAVFGHTSIKRAFVCVRPPGHHCSSSYPSGFCWINTVHIGISHATICHGLTHAAIIDFDLHHGDGSQAIAWAHNAKVSHLPYNKPPSKKAAIGYFSLHDIDSFPCELGNEDKLKDASLCLEDAHGQSIWNVHLKRWETETEFWGFYWDRYSILLDKAREFLKLHSDKIRKTSKQTQPRAAIFVSAGFDASQWETPYMQRHKRNVPTDFYARFTKHIVELANEEGLGAEGRVISVLEGGYSDRALTSGVLSHLSGLTTTSTARFSNETHVLGSEINDGIYGQNPWTDQKEQSLQEDHFDSAWWALPQLEELERLVSTPPTPETPLKPRGPSVPKYHSPTQSSSAKVIPPVNRRSNSENQQIVSTPPPQVHWTTASHELCKLLIPSGRSTLSCTSEDLSDASIRIRRERQSALKLRTQNLQTDKAIDGLVEKTKKISLNKSSISSMSKGRADVSGSSELEAKTRDPLKGPNFDGNRMHLRERKPKATIPKEEEKPKPAVRSNRRKTIAGPANVREEPTEAEPSLLAANKLLPAARPNVTKRRSMGPSAPRIAGVMADAASTSRQTPLTAEPTTRKVSIKLNVGPKLERRKIAPAKAAEELTPHPARTTDGASDFSPEPMTEPVAPFVPATLAPPNFSPVAAPTTTVTGDD